MIYDLSDQGTFSKDFGLKDQIRRAAVSVMSNIAEGASRNSKKEFIQFLHISLGSLAELETQIYIAKRLKFITDSSEVEELLEKLRRKLLNFIKSQKTSR